jgi:predicted metal-dependent peptidase
MAVRRKPEPGLYLQEGSAAAEAKLARQGIDIRAWTPHPGGQQPPEVPRDLTEMRDRQLMNLFQDTGRWLRYLTLQLAAAEVDESWAEKALIRIEAVKAYDFRKVDAKQRAYEDDDYLRAKDVQGEAYGYRKILAALVSNVDRDSFHLSRELSRRSSRSDRAGREERNA